MSFTKFTPIELLLLLAMSMLGLLSALMEVFENGATIIGGSVASFPLSNKLSVYVPSIIITPFNHAMIIASAVLSLLGLATFLTGNAKVRKVWTYLQVPYWACQFLAFVAIGIYPIAGICIGLYFGASIFLALNQNLVRE